MCSSDLLSLSLQAVLWGQTTYARLQELKRKFDPTQVPHTRLLSRRQ